MKAIAIAVLLSLAWYFYTKPDRDFHNQLEKSAEVYGNKAKKKLEDFEKEALDELDEFVQKEKAKNELEEILKDM